MKQAFIVAALVASTFAEIDIDDIDDVREVLEDLYECPECVAEEGAEDA